MLENAWVAISDAYGESGEVSEEKRYREKQKILKKYIK
jgi:hypothetical protein